jgi:hypothetical protein
MYLSIEIVSIVKAYKDYMTVKCGYLQPKKTNSYSEVLKIVRIKS